MKSRWTVVLVGPLVFAAACGLVGPPPTTVPASVGPLAAPLATTAPAQPGRVAWQAPIGGDAVIAGGAIVATTDGGVREFDARTGAPRWTRTDPRQPAPLELLVADDTVFVVVGHDVGQPPAMVAPVAAQLVALDLATGRFLWSHPINGGAQSPGLAVAGPVVALVDNAMPGTVVGLDPRTGARRWRDTPPGSCATPDLGLAVGTLLAGTGNALAVGWLCGPVRLRTEIVQGVDPGTGARRWTVPSVAEDLDIFRSPPGSNVLVAAVRSTPDPALLTEQITAFDLTTGRPLWHYAGASNVATADGDATTVCVTDDDGYQCRHVTTGALIVMARAPVPVGPFGDSGPVTEADGHIYQLVDTTHLVVRSASTGAVTATMSLPLRQRSAEGSATSSGLIAAGDGLVLVRRADVAGFPVLALAN